MTYTTSGMTSSEANIHSTGIPNPQPGRSQPRGAGLAGSASSTGSSAAGSGASGPKPSLPASQKANATRPARRANPSATAIGESLDPPSPIVVPVFPKATAARATTAPRPAGTPTARRTSSSDQAIGWSTLTTTAARVRPIISIMKNRFPELVTPWGTLMAM